MTAGVPGTGITALFYFFLTLIMPIRELYLTLRGQSSRQRWAKVLRLNAMAYGIFAVLWAEGWLLGKLLLEPKLVIAPGTSKAILVTQNVLSIGTLLTAVVTLVGVLVVMHVLRLLFARPTPRPAVHQAPTQALEDDSILHGVSP